nr:LytR C-terminal domain-containing protein [Corynebacterium sp. TAE3-ERU12]
MHVQVLNNGLVPNRAEEVATDLGDRGWVKTDHGNLPGEQYRAQSNSVFYTPGNAAEQAAAEKAAADLGPDWVVAERPAELTDQPAGIVVVII